jgi:nicotinamidase-related amidase
VAHLHRRNPAFCEQEGLGEAGPVAGFEPLPSEPLFVRTGLSAFSSLRFREWAGGVGDDQLVFVGLGACATWLATALGGADLGIRPGLVEDAICVAPLEALPPGTARDTLAAVTAPFAHWITAAALVDRSFAAHRPRAANQP